MIIWLIDWLVAGEQKNYVTSWIKKKRGGKARKRKELNRGGRRWEVFLRCLAYKKNRGVYNAFCSSNHAAVFPSDYTAFCRCCCCCCCCTAFSSVMVSCHPSSLKKKKKKRGGKARKRKELNRGGRRWEVFLRCLAYKKNGGVNNALCSSNHAAVFPSDYTAFCRCCCCCCCCTAFSSLMVSCHPSSFTPVTVPTPVSLVCKIADFGTAASHCW